MTSGSAPQWLTRNLRVLSLVSLLQDAASELLYPLLPIYLTTVLGAPPSVVGAVEGAAEGAASLTKIVSGPLGDRFARRPLIASGYGMAALGKLIVAAAGAWPGVLAGRVVDRLGKGLRGAPRDALLVDGVEPAQRGRAFGFHRTMDTLGAVIGPLLGLAGYELFDHQIGPVLYLAVIPAVLSVLLIAWVREPPRNLAKAKPASILDGTRRLPRRYWAVVSFLVLFSIANFPDALLLLRLKQIGYLGLGITTDTATAWALIAAYGLFTACYDGVGKAWISAIVSAELQSSAQGVFQGLSGFAVLAAGLWAGFLWGVDGRLPLLISGGAGAVFALALLAAAAGTRRRAR
ncbi:MFS transporter [Mycobacterium marinum]|uniref:MFS transporter n=1 Tax=Mycobacterium marinum TaxID=1781 RepID=UPI00356A9970